MLRAIERRDLIRLGALVAVLLAATRAILAAGAGSEGGSDRPSGTRSIDGVLTTVSQAELVITPSDGSAPVRFALTPAEARQLDLFHLELHARDRLPSRRFYVQQGNRRSVVRVDDL